jgi:hypothetical protein
MMSRRTDIPAVWWGWLVAAFGLTALTSGGYVLFPDAMMRRTLISTFLGSPDALAAHGEEAMRFIGLLSGISSAVSLAWMAALTFVVLGPFRRGERWAWMAVATSVVIWFVVDSGRSIAAGFPSNAMFNVVWLVMYGVPLVATYRRFTAAR